jgi:hemoglobin
MNAASIEGLDARLVRLVVDDFYAAARRDEVIGPIFNRLIPEAAWPAHLDRIEAFWSSMLLGSATYSGRPMQKHVAIDDLGDVHFERWLSLFKRSAERRCSPGVAALFVDRAERVAHSLRLGLAHFRGQDGLSLEVMRASPVAD